MYVLRYHGWLLVAVATLPLVLVESARAAQPPAAAGRAWAPKFYGFCVETHDAKKRSLAQQAEMLRELGFDGVGYPLWLDGSLPKNLPLLDEAGLDVFQLYMRINLKPGATPYDPRVPDAIRQLKGRPATISVLMVGLPPGDPQGMDTAVKVLRELGDVAAASGLRISIYHHASDWTESLRFALDVVKQANHPQVGVNFNLCHWLKVEGDKPYEPVLRGAADKIFAVTINGAQRGADTWTHGLIQPLDRGDFDNRRLLAALREIGYRGPIGLMCYGIPGDAEVHLRRSIRVWNTWQAEWDAHRP